MVGWGAVMLEEPIVKSLRKRFSQTLRSQSARHLAPSERRLISVSVSEAAES